MPSETQMVAQFLDELIEDSPASAFERATLPQGIEECLAKVDWNRREVMIGFVRSDEQMLRCLEGNYYYTYKQNVSTENLPIYYVAVYCKGTGIEYYGKVLTTQECIREQIPGKSKMKKEPCYLFTVKKWVRLEKPIRPQLYGPNPVAYTNYFLLTHSETYPELHLKNESEYRFFTELRRRTKDVVVEGWKSNVSGFDLDGKKVLFEDGIIHLIENGQEIDHCLVKDFSQKPNAMFRRLMRHVY